MLVVSEKYRSIYDFVSEDFDDKDAENLKQAILADKSVDILDGDNVNDYKNAIIQKASDDVINNNQTYKDFFDRHSLDSIGDDIVRVFAKRGHLDSLNKIVEGDGLFSLNSFVKSNNLERLLNFEILAEADEISSFAPKTVGPAVGKFEILLRFLLIKGRSTGNNNTGDVAVGSKVIEIKGQNSRPYDQSTKNVEFLFNYIDKAFNKDDSIVPANSIGKTNYTTKGFSLFLERLSKYLKNKSHSESDIIDAIVNGVADQYRVTADKSVLSIAKEYTNKLSNISQQDLKNFIGRLQLCCYKLKAGWDYLAFIYNDDWDYLCISENNIVDKSRLIRFDGQEDQRQAAKMHIDK